MDPLTRAISRTFQSGGWKLKLIVCRASALAASWDLSSSSPSSPGNWRPPPNERSNREFSSFSSNFRLFPFSSTTSSSFTAPHFCGASSRGNTTVPMSWAWFCGDPPSPLRSMDRVTWSATGTNFAAAAILFVSGVDILSPIDPVGASLNGSRLNRGGVTGENFTPSALQAASSTTPDCCANSAAFVCLARSIVQVTDLPSRVPPALADDTAFGSVTRNSVRISSFFFAMTSKDAIMPPSMPASSFISASRAAASMPVTALSESAPLVTTSVRPCAFA